MLLFKPIQLAILGIQKLVNAAKEKQYRQTLKQQILEKLGFKQKVKNAAADAASSAGTNPI
jgi:hypothetical protein